MQLKPVFRANKWMPFLKKFPTVFCSYIWFLQATNDFRTIFPSNYRLLTSAITFFSSEVLIPYDRLKHTKFMYSLFSRELWRAGEGVELNSSLVYVSFILGDQFTFPIDLNKYYRLHLITVIYKNWTARHVCLACRCKRELAVTVIPYILRLRLFSCQHHPSGLFQELWFLLFSFWEEEGYFNLCLRQILKD